MSQDDETIRITENDLPQQFILKLLGQYEARGLWGIKHTREPVDLMVKYAKTHELSLPLVQLVVTREGLFMSPIQCRLDTRDNKSLRKMESRHDSGGRFINRRMGASETWNQFEGEFRSKSTTIPSQNKESYVDCENKKTIHVDPNRKEGDESPEKITCFPSRKPADKKTPRKPTDLQLLDKYSRIDWRQRGIFFFGIDTISYGVQDLIFTRVFSMIVVADRKKKNSTRGCSPFMCHAFVCESRDTAKRVTYSLAAAFQAYGRSMKTLRGPEKPLKPSYEERPKRVIIELRSPRDVSLNDSEA